jgi:hypothetical protein
MESQMLSAKTSDSGRDFKLKEVEGRLRALEQENDMLKQKVAPPELRSRLGGAYNPRDAAARAVIGPVTKTENRFMTASKRLRVYCVASTWNHNHP